MAGKNGLVSACGPRSHGSILGKHNNNFRAHIYILGQYKALSVGAFKMNNFKKFWPFHLINLTLFIFFSATGVLLAKGVETQIKHAKEQGEIEIIINLPVKVLSEVNI